MRSAWRRLNLSNTNPAIPPLMIKCDVGASDYSIWITDLTFIWEEVLDRKRIIQRSFSIDTSIDPSEGSDQLRLLLQSLERTLEQQAGTSMTLARDHDDQKLLLRTYTPLPGSLKPLGWVIELALAPQSRLTSELVVPMLDRQVVANLEKVSLLQLVKEKDQVIAKLADKMQSNGMDLARIFPGVTLLKPGRQSSRQALGKSIRGLGEFDEQQWQNHLRTDATKTRGYIGLVSDAFANGLAHSWDGPQLPKYDNWWERLKHQDSQHIEPSKQPGTTEEEENSTQGAFERQSTPENLKPTPSESRKSLRSRPPNVHSKAQMQRHRDSDSTTDESDLEPRSAAPTESPPSKISPWNDRFTSSPRVASTKLSPTASDNIVVVAKQDAYQDKTSFPSGIDDRRESSTSSSDDSAKDAQQHLKAESRPVKDVIGIAQPAVPNAKAKLGRIGGRSKETKEDQSQSDPQSNVAASPSKAISSSRKSTDQKASGSVNDSINPGRVSRTNQPQASASPRPSSQDRANRKREQLKRELESKSQAGAKKKRKF